MKSFKYIFVLVILGSAVAQAQPKLKPFCSDGCTNSPSGIVSEDEWKVCCIHHDFEYWKGGDHEDKDNADKNLYRCMVPRSGEFIAELYFDAVQSYGDEYWGAAWTQRPQFKSLDVDELKLIAQMTPKNIDKALCPGAF